MQKRKKSLKIWCYENGRQDLLEEWNKEKNCDMQSWVSTDDVKYNTPLKAYWKCNQGHEWECPVVMRTIFRRTCPICKPEMSRLALGTKYGCLTIIDYDSKYEKCDATDVAKYYNVFSDDPMFCNMYQYQCKCGLTGSISEFDFIKKKHRYCTEKIKDIYGWEIDHSKRIKECGLRTKQNKELLKTYKRIYDESYATDYTNSFHESLEVLECVDDHYEILTSTHDKRKKGGGTYTIYKLYKCKCYLCGKEQEIKSSQFYINAPTQYGYNAYNGYYSGAYCQCHKISSFQWIVNKILKEHNVSYKVEFSFPDLYGTKNINYLKYDFMVQNQDGSIKCLIECQGEQHYKAIDEFGGEKQFKMQRENDLLKRKYASEHGIPLLEISYKNKKYEQVEAFLKLNEVI